MSGASAASTQSDSALKPELGATVNTEFGAEVSASSSAASALAWGLAAAVRRWTRQAIVSRADGRWSAWAGLLGWSGLVNRQWVSEN